MMRVPPLLLPSRASRLRPVQTGWSRRLWWRAGGSRTSWIDPAGRASGTSWPSWEGWKYIQQRLGPCRSGPPAHSAGASPI